MIKSHKEKVIQEKSIVDNIICNCCGRPIGKENKNLIGEPIFDEYLEINKLWGYLSNKEGEEDSFHICESCYDKWVSTFKIPIKKVIV
ncbi:protein of unknown function [Ruminococcaceae bacterium BL-6]|nr:protein of unknown function [Ruminococcaceae bacterium BL-6]